MTFPFRLRGVVGSLLGAALGMVGGIAWASDPSHADLARGPLRVRSMPGTGEFAFSLYGAPGDLKSIRELSEVLRSRPLGNAWDPGPGPSPGSEATMAYLAGLRWPVVFYSGGEMQILGGRARFGDAERQRLKPLVDANVFHAYQLGEWGYYFHNLAPNEPWWRAVYGTEFESFRHLMKPRGLAGYDRMPRDKHECYEVVRNYFQGRSHDLLDRVISVTGHSHYEAYAGEWGARCIGLEVGENIAFTQSKLAFARGASRQWDLPWSVQVSPWFHGACTTSGPLRQEGDVARGLDAGHSLSFYERLWLHAWFAGASMVTPENSIAIFFEKPEAPWTLTTHGQKASEVFRFMQSHDRGIPYTPIAVVLDHEAGYNGYMDKPWGILPPTAGDRELRDLFDSQLFPGADHIHTRPDPVNPEASYLRPTPVGESVDVLLSGVGAPVLQAYPVVLLAGDLQFEPAFVGTLETALRKGSRLLMLPRHRAALGDRFGKLARAGRVEVIEPWVNPGTGRSAAISQGRLTQLARELLPVSVSGDAVQYQINRLPRGWVVELIHNGGVIKRPKEPAKVDASVVARVHLRAARRFGVVREWRSGAAHGAGRDVDLTLGPGAVEYVEFSDAR